MSRTPRSLARKPHAGGKRSPPPSKKNAALFAHAYALHRQGRLAEAAKAYEQVLHNDPRDFDALHLRGVIAARSGNPEEAVDLLERAIAVNPTVAAAHSNLGAALRALKRPQEAVASYERALQLDPNTPEAYSNRGNALQELSLMQEALESYDHALTLKPDYADALYNRANALRHLERLDEALASYELALALRPNHAEAWSNRGICLSKLKRHEQALASYETAVTLQPDYAEGWSNRGAALNEMKRHEEALASYERALEFNPEYAEAWGNRGTTLSDLQRNEEALASYERAIGLRPDYAEAIYNKGLLQLAQRQFPEGFKNYLMHWEIEKAAGLQIENPSPACDLGPLQGRLLLRAEQGLGDEIFYASMLPQVRAQCSQVTLTADKRLHAIFKRSFPDIELMDRKFKVPSDRAGSFDSRASIGDLGHRLGLTAQVVEKSRRPFLVPDACRTHQIKQSPPFTGGRRVFGLSWKSANESFGDAKSVGLKDFERLLRNENLSFVNLQYGEVDTEIEQVRRRVGSDIHRLEGLDVFNDLDGLLSLIDACDFVITTSNVTAHLAGSIGKRGCVLVPFSKGRIWYWHLNDVYSFWYPSLKVFYQDSPMAWSTTINQMMDWLAQEQAAQGPGRSLP